MFGVIRQVALLREELRIPKLTFHSDLRRRAASRRALSHIPKNTMVEPWFLGMVNHDKTTVNHMVPLTMVEPYPKKQTWYFLVGILLVLGYIAYRKLPKLTN